MVFPYLKGMIVIKEIFHIVLVYLLWCFCIQYLVLTMDPIMEGIISCSLASSRGHPPIEL
jgi:hypothetical protein